MFVGEFEWVVDHCLLPELLLPPSSSALLSVVLESLLVACDAVAGLVGKGVFSVGVRGAVVLKDGDHLHGVGVTQHHGHHTRKLRERGSELKTAKLSFERGTERFSET